MTALDRYTRLETLGQWRESPDQPPTEVVVSFGNATLVLSDLNENPLCHWAMAATFRVSLDGARAVYTPDTKGFETLEIDDAEMVEAIARVAMAASENNRRTPWLRWVFFLILVTGVSAAALASPDLLRGQAIRMTSPESARKIGMDMVASLSLPICREPRADIVKAQLQARTFPETDTLLVITQRPVSAQVFPGNIVVLGEAELRNLQSADELAVIMRSSINASSASPVTDLFEQSSFSEVFKYVTTGALSDNRIAEAADALLTAPRADLTVQPMQSVKPVLRDQDWVTLQGICLE